MVKKLLWGGLATVVVVALVAVILGIVVTRDESVSSIRRPVLKPPIVGAQFHGVWSELSDDDRERILDELVANGIQWVRVDLSWSMIEPRRGAFDMKWGVPLADKVLNMAHERGLNVLAMLWLTPSWASTNGSGSDSRSADASKRVLPRDPADYANAIGWASARWKEQVQAWEVWNEPNSEDFLAPPDAAGYTELLRAAYPAVKAGNPGADVVFGGTTFVDTNWIAAAYRAGAHGYFDVMAVHPYQGDASLPPEEPADGRRERLANTAALIDLMRSNGDGALPIWYTEFGWSAHANPPGTPVWYRGVSEQVQADYLRRTLDLVRARYPEVTKVFWYTSRDLVTGRIHPDHRGLMRRDFSPRPVLLAIRRYVEESVIPESPK